MIKNVHERILLHLRATKTEIHPKPTAGLFNYQCHRNSVQYQNDNGGEVIEVIYIDGSEPCLHYLNKDESGEYLETTLGVFAKGYEYYVIRTVDPEEYMHIGATFNRGLDYWRNTYSNWFERIFIKRAV